MTRRLIAPVPAAHARAMNAALAVELGARQIVRQLGPRVDGDIVDALLGDMNRQIGVIADALALGRRGHAVTAGAAPVTVAADPELMEGEAD